MSLSDWPITSPPQALPRHDSATSSLSPILVICIMATFVTCFFTLGHDWDRSLRADDDYNVTEDVMQERAESGQIRNQLAFLALGALGAVSFLASRQKIELQNVVGTLMLATFLLCVASVIWSEEPTTTMRKLVPLVCSFSLAIGLGRALTPRQLCILAFTFALTTTGVGLLLELVLRTFQPWNGQYRFAGVTHPNTTGIELSVLCMSGYLLSKQFSRYRLVFYAIIAVATVLIVLTKSRTSVACTLFALGALWLLDAKLQVKVMTFIVGTLALGSFAIIMLFLGIDDPETISEALLLGRSEDAQSFTGRMPIWMTLFEFIGRRPLLGYGFNSFWSPENLSYIAYEHEWAIPNAHNAYVDTMLGIGVLGLGMTVATVVAGLITVAAPRYRQIDQCYLLAWCLGFFGLLNGMSESYMLDNFNFVPCLVAAYFARIGFFENTREFVPSAAA